MSMAKANGRTRMRWGVGQSMPMPAAAATRAGSRSQGAAHGWHLQPEVLDLRPRVMARVPGPFLEHLYSPIQIARARAEVVLHGAVDHLKVALQWTGGWRAEWGR